MKKLIPLIIIIAVGFFFRFYLLGSVPMGITSDEASNGYDAYSILMTGRDQWGELFPTTSFRGFGDYRAPLYTYLIIPFIAIFDLSSFAVKIPSALFGVFGIVIVYLLGKKIFDENVGLFASFLFAVSPWSIGMSRQGIESNVAMTIFLFGLLLFLQGITKPRYIVASFICFILTLYTYTSFIIFTPLAVLVLFFYHRKKLAIHWKLLAVMVTLLVISTFPFVFKTDSSSAGRFSQVGFLSDIASIGLIDDLNQRIGACSQEIPSVLCRAYENKIMMFGSRFFQNYMSHFSFEYLFISGTTSQFSLLYERGLMYLYECIFLLLGIVGILNRSKKGNIVLIFLALSVIPDSLSGGGHHSRSFIMLPFLILICAYGGMNLLRTISSMKSRYIRRTLYSVFTILILYSITLFGITYFTHFQKNYSSYSNAPYNALSTDLQKEYHDRDVYVSSQINDTPLYVFYLFYNKYDPELFQRKTNVEYLQKENGFVDFTKVNNIHMGGFSFADSFDKKLYNDPRTIFIGNPKIFPKDIKVIHEYKDLGGGVIFQVVGIEDLIAYYR